MKKITISETEEIELSDAQIELLKRLSNKAEYLFDADMDLADRTPGIYDSGECKYALSQRGWRILFALGLAKRQERK